MASLMMVTSDVGNADGSGLFNRTNVIAKLDGGTPDGTSQAARRDDDTSFDNGTIPTAGCRRYFRLHANAVLQTVVGGTFMPPALKCGVTANITFQTRGFL